MASGVGIMSVSDDAIYVIGKGNTLGVHTISGDIKITDTDGKKIKRRDLSYNISSEPGTIAYASIEVKENSVVAIEVGEYKSGDLSEADIMNLCFEAMNSTTENNQSNLYVGN